MKKILPYFLIFLAFCLSIFLWHKDILTYQFTQNQIHDYLRSQDIEDPQGLIKDRIFVSDSEIYQAAGYLYAKGAEPTAYNFQHPPLIKYLYGFSIILTGNPFWVQIMFGLALLLLTYYLGLKLFKKQPVGFLASAFLLADPLFQGMQGQALLDLGQAAFALGYLILLFFLPESWLWQGIVLGLFAASKFWSTALILVGLAYFYKLFIRKEKINYKKTLLSFLIGFLVFALSYIKNFIEVGGTFNIFAFLMRDLRFMLNHNSASQIGGPITLYLTGFFTSWWQGGMVRAGDWTILWPIALISSIFLAIKNKLNKIGSFLFLLPLVYLLLSSTQVPFTRYFILILPFVYLGFSEFIVSVFFRKSRG